MLEPGVTVGDKVLITIFTQTHPWPQVQTLIEWKSLKAHARNKARTRIAVFLACVTKKGIAETPREKEKAGTAQQMQSIKRKIATDPALIRRLMEDAGALRSY